MCKPLITCELNINLPILIHTILCTKLFMRKSLVPDCKTLAYRKGNKKSKTVLFSIELAHSTKKGRKFGN